jgi:hypothetical protein
MKRPLFFAALSLVVAALASCDEGHPGIGPRDLSFVPPGSDLAVGADMALPVTDRVFFASIGDYGSGDTHELDVANLVSNADPEFVITMGDNSYPDASSSMLLETNIGQYYSKYIGGYMGKFGIGSPINLFFPAVGNHEWYGADPDPMKNLQSYLNYFPELPGNKRYFTFQFGLVKFFVVDSDQHEPDGSTPDSVQGKWLQQELAESTTACYKLVYFHHPPYSSGDFPGPWMQWPFAAWGADAVMSGHDHVYERLSVDGVPYFINGLGGANRFGFSHVDSHSVFRFVDAAHPELGAPDWGAQFVTATKQSITFDFIDSDGGKVDSITLQPKSPCP